MTIDGTFEITLRAPQGAEPMTLALSTDGTSLTGTATSSEGVEDLQEPAYEGNTLTWKLPITKPMAPTLAFEATLDGDLISGEAKVGKLATIPFDGKRI